MVVAMGAESLHDGEVLPIIRLVHGRKEEDLIALVQNRSGAGIADQALDQHAVCSNAQGNGIPLSEDLVADPSGNLVLAGAKSLSDAEVEAHVKGRYLRMELVFMRSHGRIIWSGDALSLL